MRFVAALFLFPLVLGACANTGLRDIQTPALGPDEFMILPVKPLSQPSDYSALPVPTPGQSNLTDRDAVAEGIIAFGGKPEAAGGAVPARDAALVQQAGRLGVAPGIRQDLSEADESFRKRRGRFTSLIATIRCTSASRLMPATKLTDGARQAHVRRPRHRQTDAARITNLLGPLNVTPSGVSRRYRTLFKGPDHEDITGPRGHFCACDACLCGAGTR